MYISERRRKNDSTNLFARLRLHKILQWCLFVCLFLSSSFLQIFTVPRLIQHGYYDCAPQKKKRETKKWEYIVYDRYGECVRARVVSGNRKAFPKKVSMEVEHGNRFQTTTVAWVS